MSKDRNEEIPQWRRAENVFTPEQIKQLATGGVGAHATLVLPIPSVPIKKSKVDICIK